MQHQVEPASIDRGCGSVVPTVAGLLDDHRIEHVEVFADDCPELVAHAARRAMGG
jgi:hypothetical protein